MKGQAPPPPSDLSLLGNLSWQDVVGLKACLDNLPVSNRPSTGRPCIPWHSLNLPMLTHAPPSSDHSLCV